MRRSFVVPSLAVLALAPPDGAVLATSAPVFPPVTSVGLVPPPGMVPAAGFAGFQDPVGGAFIAVTSPPAKACSAISGMPDAV